MSAKNPIASEKTLAALEWPTLLRLLAAEAATDAGVEEILDLKPATDDEALAAVFERAREIERLVEEKTLVPELDEPLLPLPDRLESDRGGLLGPDLAPVRYLLSVSAEIASRTKEMEPACPNLEGRLSELPDLSPLAAFIEQTLDDRGRVREDASPELASAVKRGRRMRQSLYKRLESLVRRYSEHLAEETIPLHGGRLVLLLRAGAKGRLGGLIHGRSGTGRSFYFEPLEVVEENNELQEAFEEQEAERRRIFRALTEKLHAALGDLRLHLRAVAEIDLRQAAIRFGARIEATLVEPQKGAELCLVEARHPLLDPRLAKQRQVALGQEGHTGQVVPLELLLDRAHRALVITGPNAGGKTVAMKTVGLLTVMAHSSLPIPAAAGTRLPRLERVVASVGDDQDLLTDRSTFSGRLARLKEAWDEAGPGCLVLLDELGSGTDPEEGAALSIALLEALVDSGGLAIVTSHLTPLAAAALEQEGARCAAMEFDSSTGKPTFELVPGAPGSSEALALGRRLGLPAAWLDRAETLLGPGHRRLQGLLREVEALRESLVEERHAARVLKRDLEVKLARASEEADAIVRERQEIEEVMRGKLEGFKQEVARELQHELAGLKEAFDSGRKRGLVGEAVERLFAEAPILEEEGQMGEVEMGSRVRHRGLGWEGEVATVERDRVEVLVRGKRIRCRRTELTVLGGPEQKKTPRPPITAVGASKDSIPSELKLLGRRVEESLEMIDLFLDRALLSSLSEVRLVHGHGTGRLKKAVREHLSDHPAVERWRPGSGREGGDGATVATLRS